MADLAPFISPQPTPLPDVLASRLPATQTPLQRRASIATFGTSAGGEGSVFRSDETFDYFTGLLTDALLDEQGNVRSEDLRSSVLPQTMNFLEQQLGFRPTTTSELLTALGVQRPSPTSPIDRDQLSQAIRNTFVPRNEGGERAGQSNPSTGLGQVGRVSGPSVGDIAGLGAVGAVAPALGALLGPAALGTGALGLTKGQLGIIGPDAPTRPGFTTTAEKEAFRGTTRDIGPGQTGAIGQGLANRAPGPPGIGSASTGGGTLGRGDRGRDSSDRGGRSGPGSGGGPGSHGGGGGPGGAGPGAGRDGPPGFAYGGIIPPVYHEGGGPIHYIAPNTEGRPQSLQYALGGRVGYAEGGGIDMPFDPSMIPMTAGDPTVTPRPPGAGPDDVSITAQQGEFVIAKPAVVALGADFFNVLNDIFLKNPNLDPKAGLKAATSVIKKTEGESTVAQPGQNLGEQIGAAIPSPNGPFAAGGLIGAKPVKI